MNIDYSVCNTVARNSEGADRARLLYDIFCQWHIHFDERVARSEHLSFPTHLKLEGGVGIFHVGGHTDDCYPRFSPHFIQGLGQIEGEIIETLWVPLNKIAGSTRHMSKPHRAEVMDLHINDINWKKLVGIVPLLCRRIKEADKGLKKSDAAFVELDGKVLDHKREEWLAAEAKAMKERGPALDIYHVRLDKGSPCTIFLNGPTY